MDRKSDRVFSSRGDRMFLRGSKGRVGVVAVSVVVGLGLLSCGGSDKSDSASTDTSVSESRTGEQNQNSQNQQGTQNNQNQSDQNRNQNQNNQNQNQDNQNQNQNNTQSDSNQAPAFPTIAIVSCSINATSGRLTVTASSTATGGTRGVSSVYVLTYNDEGASVKTDLSALGPDTGNGDQWSTTRVAYGNGYEKNMTVVAKASTGATKSADFSGPSSPCPS